MGVVRLALLLLLLLACSRGSLAVTIWRPPLDATAIYPQPGPFTVGTLAGVGSSANAKWADPHMTFFKGWYYLVYTTGNYQVKLSRSRTITFKKHVTKDIWEPTWWPDCCPADCRDECNSEQLRACVKGCKGDKNEGHKWATTPEWQNCPVCPTEEITCKQLADLENSEDKLCDWRFKCEKVVDADGTCIKAKKTLKPLWISPHWHVWAPAMHLVNGAWYVYFATTPHGQAISRHDIHVLRKRQGPGNRFQDPWRESKGRRYKWTHANRRKKLDIKGGDAGIPNPGFVIDFELLEAGGKLYGMFSSNEKAGSAIQAVYITEMADPLTPTGRPMVLTKPDKIWEKPDKILEEQGLHAVNEGPTALYAPDGGIFIAYSASHASSNDYCLGLLTLKKDGDPMDSGHWTKAEDPVFSTVLYSKHDKKRDSAIGPGHNSFVKGKRGTYWIVYHVHTGYGGYSTGAKCPGEKPNEQQRESRAQKFRWTRSEPTRPNFPAPGST